MDRKRSLVSSLAAASFIVLVVSGTVAFFQPFSLTVTGLHALMGFVFTGLIILHVSNNLRSLARYFRKPMAWGMTALVLTLTGWFIWQPEPVRGLLRLSQNLGPALDRFEMTETDLSYHYRPAPQYSLALSVRVGPAFDFDHPPQLAIWLENASFYHIKTLYSSAGLHGEPGVAGNLPYWDFKVRGWKAAKRAAVDPRRKTEPPELPPDTDVDGVSAATRNSSFDPADYILPPPSSVPMPYRLLMEINQPDDQQPSLIYCVEIDNADPHTYQLLELVGFPQRESTDEDPTKDPNEDWALYYVDERVGSALELVDSALLTIDRRDLRN